MTDERDPKISARYRELGAEEPPRALDEAILAASRRAVESRPAPLVAPTGRRRWYFPVAAAAVIALSVAVTLQIERQRPEEMAVADAPPAQAQRQEAVLADARKKEKVAEAPAAIEERKVAPTPMRSPQAFTPEPPPAVPAPPPAPPASADFAGALAKSQGDGARADSRRMEAELQIKPRPSAAAPAPQAVQGPPLLSPDLGAAGLAAYGSASPERRLEHIAELRRQGKDEEADKLLAEFRKAHPDYPLTDEMRAKVERKK